MVIRIETMYMAIIFVYLMFIRNVSENVFIYSQILYLHAIDFDGTVSLVLCTQYIFVVQIA